MSRRRRTAGFTLIELTVVIFIVAILASVALPNYRAAIQQSKEAVLREDLYRFRDVIDQYYADKGNYPSSLDALVDDGYLRFLPVDPITGAPDWKPVPAEADPAQPDAEPGIWDVKSNSELVSMAGTPYAEW